MKLFDALSHIGLSNRYFYYPTGVIISGQVLVNEPAFDSIDTFSVAPLENSPVIGIYVYDPASRENQLFAVSVSDFSQQEMDQLLQEVSIVKESLTSKPEDSLGFVLMSDPKMMTAEEALQNQPTPEELQLIKDTLGFGEEVETIDDIIRLTGLIPVVVSAEEFQRAFTLNAESPQDEV